MTLVRSTVLFDGGHSSSVVGSVSEVEHKITAWRANPTAATDGDFVYLDTNEQGTAQIACDVNRVVGVAGRSDS